MNMTPWHSQRSLDDFFSTINRALVKRPNHEHSSSSDWSPAVDIVENEQNFQIKAELPEVNKDDIKVNIENNILSFSGERHSEHEDKKNHRIERSYGSFSRSFSLPDNVDETAIKAESKNGMLYLTLPKKAAVEKTTNIEIH
jgi:HSP20 family protein